MKFSRILPLVAALLAVASLQAQVQDYGWVAKQNSAAATNTYVVFPAALSQSTQPVLTSYSATGDHANAVLVLRAGTAVATITATSAANTTTINVPHDIFDAEDTIVIQRSDGVCTRHIVASTNWTTIVISANQGTASYAGDKVFVMGNSSTLPVAVATVTASGEIFAAPLRKPLLVECWLNTSLAKINNATVCYKPLP